MAAGSLDAAFMNPRESQALTLPVRGAAPNKVFFFNTEL